MHYFHGVIQTAPSDICNGVTHRINDAAQPLEDEHGRPVVVQIVPLRRLYADGHEGFGFRLCTCEQQTHAHFLLRRRLTQNNKGPSRGKPPSVHTCRHVLQHLQQHVLSLVNELGALHHQLPQAEVAVEHRAHQPALEVPLD